MLLLQFKVKDRITYEMGGRKDLQVKLIDHTINHCDTLTNYKFSKEKFI